MPRGRRPGRTTLLRQVTGHPRARARCAFRQCGRSAGVASTGRTTGEGHDEAGAAIPGNGLLLVASTGAVAADGGRTAVFAVGKCDEATAIAARSFRSALTAKPGMKVATEAQTAQPFGGSTERTLAEVSGAIGSARSDFYGGQTAQARTTLQGALDDVTRLAPSDARWAAERDALTLLAQMQQKSDPKGAEAALNRVLPGRAGLSARHQQLPAVVPEVGRTRSARRRRRRALRGSRSAPHPRARRSTSAGRKLGVGPVSVRVPPGEYRVEADWGHLGAVRTITVPSAPVGAERRGGRGGVSRTAAPAWRPPTRSRAGADGEAHRRLRRIVGVHPESAGDDSYMVVTSTDAQGQDVREARVKVQPGAPTTEALALLAGWARGGRRRAAGRR